MQGHLDRSKLEEYSKEYSELKGVREIIDQFFSVVEEIEETSSLLNDKEFASLAENELSTLKSKKDLIEQDLKLLLIPKDVNDDRSVIIEIRAGTGGDEASLFASDLFKMYQRFAEKNNCKIDLIEQTTTDLGGLKEVIFHLSFLGTAKFQYNHSRILNQELSYRQKAHFLQYLQSVHYQVLDPKQFH